jgi:hypothetical protein
MGWPDRLPCRCVCETDLPPGKKPARGGPKVIVRGLKRICMALIQTGKKAWRLPKSIAIDIGQQKRRGLEDEHEVERLDRIRNPWKYLGK